MKTYQANNATVIRKWHLVDAADHTLGRLASAVAMVLRGKHKPEYTAHVDTGDYVVIINADKIKVTGNKAKDKIYYRYSGYQSGMKAISFEKLLVKSPRKVIESAVRGMLPKNILGRAMLKKLKTYAGSSHPHTAQVPESLQIADVKYNSANRLTITR
jgi:large subunit ribosomal protein L13